MQIYYLPSTFRFVRSLLLVLLTLLVTACASVPMATLEEDAKAKSFTVAPNRSSIYVFRDETFGAAISVPVSLNGKVMGRTAAQTYFLWEVQPGEHEVSSIAENISTVKLRTVPGRAYYIWQEIKMGLWQPRTLLQEVDEERGRAGVNASKRAIPEQ